MMSVAELLKTTWRKTSLVGFGLLVCFWLVKLTYSLYGLVTNGWPGVRNAIIHGSTVPDEPSHWGRPQWGTIALQYILIALLTLLFGLNSRSALKRLWDAILDRPPTESDR